MYSTQWQFSISKEVFSQLQQLTKDFAAVKSVVSQIDGTVKESFADIKNSTSQLQSSLKNISVASTVENIRSAAQAFGSLATPGMEFETQMANLSAITGIVGADLDRLKESSREMGKATGLGASQSAEAYKLLASNIDVSKIGIDGLINLQKETITLSQAAGVDLPTAANTMANSINQFSLQAKDASRVIDVLANGAKYGAAEVPDLAESLKYVGTTAGTAGMSIEETTAVLEVMSQNALKGSMAGTSLNMALSKIQTELKVDLKNGGIFKAIELAKPHINDATWMTKTFGEEGARAMRVLVTQSGSLKTMNDRMSETGTAAEQAKVNTSTYAEEVKRIKAHMEDFKISMSEATGGFLPYMSVMGDSLGQISGLIPVMSRLGDMYSFITSKQKLQALWTGIATGATNVFTAANTALNFVMSINPIFIVIGLIAALVGSIIYAWNHFEGFRKVVLGLWESFKQVFTNIGAFFKQIFAPIAEAIAAFKNGDYLGAGKAVLKMAVNLTPVGMAAEAMKFSKEKGFTTGVSDAFKVGEAKGVKSWQADHPVALKPSQFTAEAVATKATDNTKAPPISGDKTKENKQKESAVSSEAGGGKATNITYNIKSLIGELNINVTSVKDGGSSIRAEVAKALLAATNDAQIAVTNI